MTSPLFFHHHAPYPYLSPDVQAVLNAAGTGYNIEVTLNTTANASGQLVMWWGDPTDPTFLPANAQALLPQPGVGNVGTAQIGMPPSQTTQFLAATPTAPAVFTLGWEIPSTLGNPNVGFFFQAVDESNPTAPRTWHPGDALNAQCNVFVNLPAFIAGNAAGRGSGPDLGRHA